MESTELMNYAVLEDLPRLHTQSNVDDPEATMKYFLPGSGWTWYAIEYSPRERVFYGLIVGTDVELGNFYLDDLYALRNEKGEGVKRDIWFMPKPVSELRKLHES